MGIILLILLKTWALLDRIVGVVESRLPDSDFYCNFALRIATSTIQQALLKDSTCLRSQIVTSNKRRGGIRYLPYAFTELGVAMLSSVLKSEAAISVNRDIMRAFVSFRHIVYQTNPDSNKEWQKELQTLRDEMNEILADQNDINEMTRAQIDAISTALAELQSKEPKPRKKIGFIQEEEE